MKKFILSATLALACFSAQAGNEVIKNDDDKNPKNKAKVVKKSTLLAGCTACGFTSAVCDGVATSIGSCQTADTCVAAGRKLLRVLGSAGCE